MLLITIPTVATTKTHLALNSTDLSYTDFYVDYFEVPDGTYLDIEDIRDINFTNSIKNKISLGFSNNKVWFHIKVHNSDTSNKRMILEFTEIAHHTVNLYTISQNSEFKKNGLNIPVNQREIKEVTPSFFLDFKADETKDIYLEIESKHGIYGAIELKTKELYYEDIQIKKYFFLAYLVALGTIILYNFIYFIYFKDRIYLYYIIHVGLFGLWVANFKGLLLPFIDKEIFNLLKLIIPLFFISLLLFSQAILKTEVNYPKLHKIYNIIIYITLASIILMIFLTDNGVYILNLFAIPALLSTLIASIWFLNKKRILELLYITTLTVFTIGISLLALLTLGMLPYSYILSSGLIVAVSIIEIILFSFLLAYHINLVRKESLDSREKLIEQQKTESTRLFHTVAEKTKELNRAKKEIEKELKKKIELEKHLQHLASTDPMTNLYNRRRFFEISDLEVSNSKDNKESLACLVLDIDHFKSINDTYGHDVGDKVISAVSKLMVLNTRSKDHIGRIGGEEFAILMPKTNSEAAYLIADRLRKNISKHTIAIDGHDATIKITVSIGLSKLEDDKSETIHTLLKRADTALYKAKHNGRNQVRCLPEIDTEKI
jgi:diguanylate cyclase (GGDEF)-like protein